MASLIVLKRRIGSIRNTRQITKAMELVSSSKLRRAQVAAVQSRAYREAAYELLARLNAVREVAQQPLFKTRLVKARGYVVITSNSGLAGAYNANVLKLLTKGLQRDEAEKVQSRVITVGNKGMQYVRRLANVEWLEHYPAFGDEPTEADIIPLLKTVNDNFEAEKVDEVHLLYTDFKNSITQTATDLQLLPAKADLEAIEGKNAGASEAQSSPASRAVGVMNFEPDVEIVIDTVGRRLVQSQIWQALLESLASEHAMRAIAMKNATDNANDLIDDYTLEYNTARQGAITQEIAEISGGAEALNG